MSSEALIKAAWNRYSSSVWSTPLQFGGACADEAHRFVERVSGRWERAARTMEEMLGQLPLQIEWSERQLKTSSEATRDVPRTSSLGTRDVTPAVRSTSFDTAASARVSSGDFEDEHGAGASPPRGPASIALSAHSALCGGLSERVEREAAASAVPSENPARHSVSRVPSRFGSARSTAIHQRLSGHAGRGSDLNDGEVNRAWDAQRATRVRREEAEAAWRTTGF